MDELIITAVCKELNGGTTTSEVTFSEENMITFVTTESSPKVSANNINSGEATSGQVLKADGEGGASWSD